jgi:hypothetical protein
MAILLKLGNGRPGVLYLKNKLAIPTRQINLGVVTERVPADIAQSLGNHLKQFCRQPVINLYLSVCIDIDFDSRY